MALMNSYPTKEINCVIEETKSEITPKEVPLDQQKPTMYAWFVLFAVFAVRAIH